MCRGVSSEFGQEPTPRSSLDSSSKRTLRALPHRELTNSEAPRGVDASALPCASEKQDEGVGRLPPFVLEVNTGSIGRAFVKFPSMQFCGVDVGQPESLCHLLR
jgi:hypothetical protein